eukprot:scaffold24347_cov19-Tisochrysis_lutea.AAC.1
MGEQGIPISQIGSPSQEEAQPQLTWEGPCREAVAWNLPLTGGYVPSEIVQAASQRFQVSSRCLPVINATPATTKMFCSAPRAAASWLPGHPEWTACCCSARR